MPLRNPGHLLALCILLRAATATAQRAEPETGSVTGRVLCADTRGPARMAGVVLVPIVDTSFLKNTSSAKGTEDPREPTTRVMQTGLDGTFVLPKVRPGNYYLIAQKTGYLQPLSLITREQMNKPDENTAKLMSRLLTPVTVTANHATQAETRLFRGAAFSGTVRYDDGSPVIGASVEVLQKNGAGKWRPLHVQPAVGFSQSSSTDDQGHYRLSGFPAGEYLLATSIELTDSYVDHLFADAGSSSSNTRYELHLYNGDTYRETTAKRVKVAEGEDASGADMTLRLSELHTLSGSILAPDGHVANAAKVALLWADDKSEFLSTVVRPEDNAFHFDFVPDGEYTLRVTDARDVTRVEIPNCTNCVPPTHTDEKTVRTFGNVEQPIILHTDIQAITISIRGAGANPVSASN